MLNWFQHLLKAAILKLRNIDASNLKILKVPFESAICEALVQGKYKPNYRNSILAIQTK
jgi:hypothetical protein